MDKEGWDESSNTYSRGELPTKEDENKPTTTEYGLSEYLANPWREKVSVQIKGSAELSEAVFVEATKRGTYLHQLLSGIHYRADLDQYSDLEERVELTEIVEHAEIADWFDPRWEVFTEVPILLPNGDLKRIDRINRSKEETVVIDFKSGSKRDKDKRQVMAYKRILSDMGHINVKGYLIYLTELSVVAV